METLTRGKVAQRAGVNIETVRYYEQRRLLPPPPRTPSGYRQYGEEAVDRIRFVKRAQELGFTLQEIRELLSLRAAPEADRREVKARTERKIRQITAKIHDLQRMRDTLLHLAAACDGPGPIDDCPILHALEGHETDIDGSPLLDDPA